MVNVEAEMSSTQNVGQRLYNIIINVLECLILLMRIIVEAFMTTVKIFIGVEAKDVSGDIVLITGAGHGIGKELALQYTDLGSIVVCVDINEASNNETVKEANMLRKGTAYGYTCDVSNWDKVLALSEKVKEEVGHVSLLINNVGIMPTHPLEKHTPEEIRKLFDINVFSQFWTLNAFLPQMKEKGRGHIVSISSIAGLVGLSNLVPYCGTKFALRGMMEALREEIREGPYKNLIHTTTIFPFMVNTGLCKKPKVKFPMILGLLDPKKVAASIIDAQRKNVDEITIPSGLMYMNNFFRLLPTNCALMFMESSEDCGTYYTASKDGMVRSWTTQFQPIKTARSSSHYLKITPTWIIAMKALSDVRVVVISSSERELRFYDTTANNFNLRIVIRSVPYAISSISYDFGASDQSYLILGDVRGNVKLLQYSPKLRGPFQSKPGTALMELTWQELLKGKMPAFKIKEYNNVHVDTVKQTYYWQKYNFIFSAAECHTASSSMSSCPGVVVTDPKDNSQLIFSIPKGVTTFWLEEESRILATGGPDAYLRIWDALVPNKPTVMLSGHHAGIVYIFIQSEERKIYTIDHSKIIKVWSLAEHTVLQSYSELLRVQAHESQFVCYYNQISRELWIGARMLTRIMCCPKLRLDLNDGNTHAGPVSIVLFNELFTNIVTCGLDSYIIVWDPWTGKRQIMIKHAHTIMTNSQLTDVEITAACFDPKGQLLLTGARDGSLKVWNFNNAVCIRHMHIEPLMEVTAVFWVPERILACGWNMHVTEFPDIQGMEYGDEKKWAVMHNDDITCGALRIGQALVTGSYSGQLFFWKLETGQAYKEFDVERPTEFIKLVYNRKDERRRKLRPSKLVRASVTKSVRNLDMFGPSLFQFKSTYSLFNDSDSDYDDDLELPVSVQAMLFLQTRKMTKDHGTLLVSLDNGQMQVYSHHHSGGFITQFNTIHKTGDCVISMATDKRNKYLFTGTAFGYIKIWLIQNFCIPDEEMTKISMPKLYLRFTFLRKEKILGRAKRMVRNQPEPMLVNSYKGHMKSITSISFIHKPKVLVTGSHDYSVRLWTLGGRYLGTLGSPIPLVKMTPATKFTEGDKYRVPPDIQKVASSTTLKVISGIYRDRLKELRAEIKLQEQQQEKKDELLGKCTYGKTLTHPILGRHFQMPPKTTYVHPPVFDKSLPYIPVYSHLGVYEATPLERPPSPELLKKTKKLDFMEQYGGSGSSKQTK